MCNLRNCIIAIIVLGALLIIFLPLFFSQVSTELNFSMPNRPLSLSPQFNSGLSTLSQSSIKKPLTLPLSPGVAWVIQVADFKKYADANVLVQRLRQKGFKAYTRQVMMSGIAITRVFVGPEIKSDQIKNLVAQLNKVIQLKSPVVTAFDPLLL